MQIHTGCPWGGEGGMGHLFNYSDEQNQPDSPWGVMCVTDVMGGFHALLI